MMSIDLTRTVTMWFAAPDEPLVHAVNDPQRLDAPEDPAVVRGLTPFALTADAVNGLSNATHRVLSARNMDPRSMTIDAVVMSLER